MAIHTQSPLKPGNQRRVYRNEFKYYLRYTDYYCLTKMLQKTMPIDIHCKSLHEYWIRSLYFDTLTNSDFHDKIMGIKKRKKIRLRIYDVAQDQVKLEIKHKSDRYIYKETTMIGRQTAKELIIGDREVLLEKDDSIRNKVYYLMSTDYYRPVIMVDYEREAYMYPFQHIRLTFDKNIRANMVDFDIFNQNQQMVPVLNDHLIILEVKYNHMLPYWIKAALSGLNAVNSAISKYCLSRVLF